MSGFNVTLSNGTKVTINAGEKLDDIKAKFGEEAGNIFDEIDANSNGTLDNDEIEGLKTKLKDNHFTVEVAQDGRTPKRAYNEVVQNMGSRYNQDTLKGNFKVDDADKWEVKSGNTLWDIAKDTLDVEGLPTDVRSINNRIAQIANLNGISDVNNVRIGTKLVYKLTDEAVQKVKDAGGDSAAAFGGGGVSGTTNGGTNPPAVKPPQATAIEDKESSIKLTPNGLNMGKGKPVDKDGNELKDFKDPKFKQGGGIMKYTSGDKVMYQVTYAEDNGTLKHGVKLSADSIAALTDMKTKFEAAVAKLKKGGDKAANLAALKEAIEVSGSNTQVVMNAARFLRGDDFVDRTSDDYKAFVKDIILTRNADVLGQGGLFMKFDTGEVDMSALENDKEAHEMLAGLYQEIRAKEKKGERLTDEEIALKDVVVILQDYNGYKIPASDGVHEKYMAYGNMDGTPMYQVQVDGNWYYAKDEKLLDEFLTKLEKAKDDAGKAALFKEYANNKTDSELAKCLAENAQTLHASNEDIIALVNSHGLEVIDKFEFDIYGDVLFDKSVVDAVAARAREIYTTDKGNLENAVYLYNVMVRWIENVELTDAEKAAVKPAKGQTQAQAEVAARRAKRDNLKEEIAETYFEKAADGRYTFNPSRIPTEDEARNLALLPEAFNEALVKYTKLEDMGKGRYNEGIEHAIGCIGGTSIVSHYAGMVDKMDKKEDVIDFIDNKVATFKGDHLPYDKILEKFPDDKDIKAKLLKYVSSDSTISPENAKKLIDLCGKDKIAKIVTLGSKNVDAAKERIRKLLKENSSDKAFVLEVVKFNDSVIPFDTLTEIDANQAKWDDETKAAVFEKVFNGRVFNKDRAKPLATAVQKGWAVKVDADKYRIGDTIYETNWYDEGADGNVETKDDNIMNLSKISAIGYERGQAMFKEIDTIGSAGNIAKMLNGVKDDRHDYTNYITPDNVTGIIRGFAQKSPEKGMMQLLAEETFDKTPQNTANKVPVALIAKAKALELSAEKYQDLETFVNAHNDKKKSYSKEDAKQLDKFINALTYEIVKNSGV